MEGHSHGSRRGAEDNGDVLRPQPCNPTQEEDLTLSGRERFQTVSFNLPGAHEDRGALHPRPAPEQARRDVLSLLGQVREAPELTS